MEKLALSPREFAAATGLSLTGIYAGLRTGSIPARRFGRRLLIPRDAIIRWMSQTEALGEAAASETAHDPTPPPTPVR